MPTSALFLDRDGVINVDSGYVHRIDQFHFIPGIFDLTRFAAQELGWLIVVVTNQSGIGRGYYDEAAYEALTAWMSRRFAVENAPLARVYHSPHHPVHGIGRYRLDHPWRKPKPGMLLQAAADLDLDLATSALVGSSTDDMRAGAAAGVGLLIRLDPTGQGAEPDLPHQTVPDLPSALQLLRSVSRQTARARETTAKDDGDVS